MELLIKHEDGMLDAFPPDIQQFVQQELAAGHFKSEEELVVEAIRQFRESSARLPLLKEELRRRLDQLDRGEGIPLEDDEALAAFFDQIETDIEHEFAAKKRNPGE